MVFEKWNITTNGEANQNKFHKRMTRRSRVMSLWNYFDLPSHELWYFISQKPLFQKFHFKNNSIWWTMQQILRNDFEKWYIMALVPWYIISQNHFSKFGCLCFVYIHLQWWAGPYTLDQLTQCWLLVSQHQFTENMKRIFQGNSSIYY